MLSYSSYGSAKHADVDKVSNAVKIAKEKYPDLVVDGELQLDAALVEEVGQLKAPGSPVAGHANTLVFPSLEAGNIGYKLVQRLAKAPAYGPVLQRRSVSSVSTPNAMSVTTPVDMSSEMAPSANLEDGAQEKLKGSSSTTSAPHKSACLART